jgi:hypothetical protein
MAVLKDGDGMAVASGKKALALGEDTSEYTDGARCALY